MSIGGDEYDERGRAGDSGASTGRGSARHGTRTRLPGEDGDVYGVGKRPAGRPGRSLLTVLSVVVLLIAAIAFANRGGDSDSDADGGSGGSQAEDAKEGKPQPTQPTGEKPVKGTDDATGIPSDFPQSEQGAQSAAANYAVALGSVDMFEKAERGRILDAVMSSDSVGKFKAEMDKAYTAEFFGNVGLEKDGSVPDGMTFVSRTSPVGTKVTDYADSSATVEVWCSGLLGLTGNESTKPVTNQWFTITFELTWSDGDWKAATHSQKSGPTPVSGDNKISGSKDIAEAVEGYGGFTYAR